MAKFKVGEVVDTTYDGKAAIISKFSSEYGEEYQVILIQSGYKTDLYEHDLFKTKDAPFKVLKADRKNIDGDVDYIFYFAYRGRKKFLVAGCRFFTSLANARKHWKADVSQWDYALTTCEREHLNKASLKIIDKFEKKMKG